MNGHKLRKSTTGMTLLSLLRVQVILSFQNGTKRLQDFVLTVQRMVTCTYHLNPHVATSIYRWRYQAIQYCACANGLPCLFRLTTPPFIFQLNLNKSQQILCKVRFNYYLYFSKSFDKYSSNIMYIRFHRRKTMRRKLQQNKNSFEIDFLKKCYIKIYLYFNHLVASQSYLDILLIT